MIAAMPRKEPAKIGPETRALLDQLIAWCNEPDAPAGRQSQVAEVLGVTRYAVHHWIKGRQIPSAEHALALQKFLKAQRRRK